MGGEERLMLNNYIEDLYQAMQIGSITFEPKHSSELYDLISKVLKENQQLKGSLQTYEVLLKANVEENKQLKEQLEQRENQKYKEVIDKSYIRVMHLLDYYNHYRVLPKSIIEELINLQIDLEILKEVE